MAAMIPIGGQLATAGKLGMKAADVASTAYKPVSGVLSDISKGIPNSSHIYTAPNGKPISKYFYNDSGKLEFEINYKNHNMGGPHGHQMNPPGDIRSGHYPEAHVPFMLIPKKYW